MRAKCLQSSSFNGSRHSASFRRIINHNVEPSRSTRNCSILGGNRVIPFLAWEKSDMTVLSEITELLRRWDVWKRVEEAPARIDALERRIAELESRPQRAPGKACPKCGALEFRTESTSPATGGFGALGVIDRHMKCGACGHTETHREAPK
jgi:predicted nucleic-acid-binding Zn-ribbon protein